MTDTERAAAWRRDGYLMVRGAIDTEYLDPIRAYISERVDGFARACHADGHLASLHDEEPFGRRYAAIREELAGRPEQPQIGVRGHRFLCTRALYDLYTHPAITDVLRVIIGPEVTLHGISVIRVKLPEDSQSAFPWHQDSHYYNEHKTGRFEANTEHMRVITTWVPLVDVDTDNGCLWVIPGSHRWGFLSAARAAATGHVLIPEDVERRGTPTPLPMKAGDVVFLTNLTLHASKVNGSDRVRWSHDFRYPPDRGLDPGRQPGARGHRLPGHQVAQITAPNRCACSAPAPLPTWEEWQTHQPGAPRRARTDGLREEAMAERIGTGEFTYEVEPAWAQVPDGWIIKDTPDVLVDDARDRVYVFTRWKHPVMVFDRAGKFITSWGSDLFTMPHGLSMGPDGHLYLVDAFGHCVRKCTTGGEVLQVWGTPDRSSGHYSGKPFNGPTKVAFDPDTRDMYVADGYGNARVHKYSASGEFLFSWGEPGQGPSQFNLVHGVQTDRTGTVYVASREGHRVQLFDSSGSYLSEWRTGVHRPNGFPDLPRRAATGSWSTSARRAPASARTAASAGSATAWRSSSSTARPWRASTTTPRS